MVVRVSTKIEKQIRVGDGSIDQAIGFLASSSSLLSSSFFTRLLLVCQYCQSR